MSAEMRSFMGAYNAVHNKEVKENLDNSRDSISEMNLSQLTESDLHEAVEQVLEVWFAEGHTVPECEAIVESILVPSQIPGRQGKIERLLEAFGAVIGRVKEKSARTAVESFALYRKGKQVKESWSNKFSHENGNEKLHERLVAADLAGVKNGMLEAYKRLPLSKMAMQISSKARKQGMEIGQGKQSSIKPNQQIGKMGGVMDTHNPTRSQAKEKANKAPGFSKRSKSVDEDFAGNYEGPLYAPHPDLEEGYKEIDKKKENAMYRRAGNLARKGIADNDSKAKEKSAKIVTAITRQKENERFSKMADEKARDNYKEELEVSQIRKDWAAAYRGIYEAKVDSELTDSQKKKARLDRKTDASPRLSDAEKEDARQYVHKSERGMKKPTPQSGRGILPGKYAAAQRRKGLNKEEVEVVDEAKKGDGNLANNYPPYDKVTRGDVIAGAKGEDQMGGKKCKKCGKSPCECPKDEVKEESKWIKGAIKKPGSLHKQLGVPEGEKIPEAKLRAAARRSGKIGQRARLALTLKGLKKEDTDWEFLDNLIESEKFTEEQIEKIAKDL